MLLLLKASFPFVKNVEVSPQRNILNDILTTYMKNVSTTNKQKCKCGMSKMHSDCVLEQRIMTVQDNYRCQQTIFLPISHNAITFVKYGGS